jgi:phage terminase small subunit
MPLTELQRKFCEEYVRTGNATSAAKSAGYSVKTANEQGTQLLRKPLVAAEIARLTGRNEKKSALTAEKILEALNNLVDLDPASCYDENGKLLPINKMPLEARKALTGIDGEKLKFSSRLGAIELSAKLLGMVREQQTQQQAVQIVIAAPAAAPVERVDVAKLRPEWE